jgi:hypothetical protein
LFTLKDSTMLIQLLIQEPRMLGTILGNTPGWVWGLLAGLIALGASQLFPRRASLLRVNILPVSMVLLSAYGMVSALGTSGRLLPALLLWFVVAALVSVVGLAWRRTAPAGSRYNATARQYFLPGSATPLLLITCVFLTKYVVGVELAMQPQLVQNSGFAFGLSALYGAFNGLFVARAARLWLLARGPAGTVPAATLLGA